MLEALTQLPPIHLAYLALVVTAFTAFGATLATVHIWSNLSDRRQATAPIAVVTEAPIVYAQAA